MLVPNAPPVGTDAAVPTPPKANGGFEASPKPVPLADTVAAEDAAAAETPNAGVGDAEAEDAAAPKPPKANAGFVDAGDPEPPNAGVGDAEAKDAAAPKPPKANAGAEDTAAEIAAVSKPPCVESIFPASL